MKRELPYNALGRCLEFTVGNKYQSQPSSPEKYSEPKQGFRTVLFKDLPLQLNYMRRRPNKSPFFFSVK